MFIFTRLFVFHFFFLISEFNFAIMQCMKYAAFTVKSSPSRTVKRNVFFILFYQDYFSVYILGKHLSNQVSKHRIVRNSLVNSFLL